MIRRAWTCFAVAAIGLAAVACDDETTTGGTTTGTASTGGTGGTAGTGGTGGTGANGGTGGTGASANCPQVAGTTESVAVATQGAGTMCIDATEVTKGQYEAWLSTSPSPSGLPGYCSWNVGFTPSDPDWPPAGGDADLPVIGVNWCDALAYCLDNGKRLCGALGGGNVPPGSSADPAVSEWFNACTERGASTYPYGSSFESDTCNGMTAGNGEAVDAGSMSGCQTASGVFDLSGNVWEWEHSCNAETGESDHCNIRGGAFNSTATDLACTAATPTNRNTSNVTLGFRCCADPTG